MKTASPTMATSGAARPNDAPYVCASQTASHADAPLPAPDDRLRRLQDGLDASGAAVALLDEAGQVCYASAALRQRYPTGASDGLAQWLPDLAPDFCARAGQASWQGRALLASLELIERGDERRRHLHRLTDTLRDGLAGSRWQLMPSPTAIQPVIIGDNHEALRVALALFERGLWVPAIRPPTVPAGSARLRVTLSAAHTEAQVQLLLSALDDCWRKLEPDHA